MTSRKVACDDEPDYKQLSTEVEAVLKYTWSIALSCLIIGLGGCASANLTPTPSSPGYPPFEGEVQVLSQLPSPGTYDHVGVVTVDGAKYTNTDVMLRRLRKEASSHGANAIVPQTDSKTWERDGKKKAAAWAIRLR